MEEENFQNPPKIKRGKFKDQEEEDHISLLPDCLLIDIISRLPTTKEAIRTGTLSKRWQHLWPQVSNLVFIFNMYLWAWSGQRLSDFVSFVDKTITQCRQFDLTKFKLRILYDIIYESQVNNWIRYAFTCNVQDLDLSILNQDDEAEFVLDQFFFVNSNFTRLKLEGCVFNPAGVISWSKLTSLSISQAVLSEDLIQNILSGSPLLETLELRNCYGFGRIDITSKSVKNFVFHGYILPDAAEDPWKDHADIIEINAPYIVLLTIAGDLYLWKLLLLNVSSLVKAELNYVKLGYYETTRKEGKEEMLKAFIESLHHVKDFNLKIGISCVKALSRLEAKGVISSRNMEVANDVPLTSSDSDSDSDSNESGDSDGDSEELSLDDGLESEDGEVD